ncbi:MAG: ribosome assembly RNA-binding protein YhbY [Chitinivibrionales bacterium]|nr:ribosome assembly RNA-binding protein YhbY [Chitinivibrionales bacterium]
MATSLTSKQRRHLKGLAHGSRPPLFQVGREGLSEQVVRSLDAALDDHELIKVQFLEGADIDRKDYARQLSEQLDAALVQLIGFKAVYYRPRKENPRIVLPQ